MRELRFDVALLTVKATEIQSLASQLRSASLKATFSQSEGQTITCVSELLGEVSGLGDDLCALYEKTADLLIEAAQQLSDTDQQIGMRY